MRCPDFPNWVSSLALVLIAACTSLPTDSTIEDDRPPRPTEGLPALSAEDPAVQACQQRLAEGDRAGAAAAIRELAAGHDFQEKGQPELAKFYWLLLEVAEQQGDLDTAAQVLGGLVVANDYDAPKELWRFLRAHGREALERQGVIHHDNVSVWMEVGAAADAGDWVAARAVVDRAASLTSGFWVPPYVVAARIFLGDLLRQAGKFEAALVSYAWAAQAQALAQGTESPSARHDLAFVGVRLERMFYDMGEPAWSLEAMQLVNPFWYAVKEHPPTFAVDAGMRERLSADADRAMAQITHLLSFGVHPPEDRDPMDLLAACRGAREIEGSERTLEFREVGLVVRDLAGAYAFELPSLGLTLDVAHIAMETTHLGFTGTVTRNFGSSAKPFCMRWSNDGAVYIGTAGFESHGVMLRPDAAPTVGSGYFGRPPEELLAVKQVYENEVLPGRALPEFGERRRLTLRTQGDLLLTTEGYLQGERVVPDGPTVVILNTEEAYASQFALGDAGPWRRAGSLTRLTPLSPLSDVDGSLVAWVSPTQWVARIDDERRRARDAEIAKINEQIADQIRWQQMVDRWHEEAAENTPPPSPQGWPCYLCDGTGTISTGGGWEDHSSWVTDSDGNSHYVTSSRWIATTRVQCTECGGSGYR